MDRPSQTFTECIFKGQRNSCLLTSSGRTSTELHSKKGSYWLPVSFQLDRLGYLNLKILTYIIYEMPCMEDFELKKKYLLKEDLSFLGKTQKFTLDEIIILFSNTYYY